MIVKNLFIEVTSNCNAACLECVRQMPGSNVPKNLHMSKQVFEQLIDDISDTLELVNFEGSYSDAPMHPNFLEFCKYIIENTDAKILINTNGSYRNADWWANLGKLFANNDKYSVNFGIDGIDQETHTMYRVDTFFDKIMDNAQAYINAGGKAIWKMLPFDFNRDLEDQARQMAMDMNFFEFRRNKLTRYYDKAYRYIVASRWYEYNGKNIEDEDYNYALGDDPDFDKFFELVDKMEPYIKFEPDPEIHLNKNLDIALDYLEIPKCQWREQNQIQVGANGVVWQCCHMQSGVHEFRTDNSFNEHARWFKHYSYEENWNNINYNRIYDILSHRYFTHDLYDSFKNSCNSIKNPRMRVCSKKCGDFGIENKQF